MPLKRSLKPRAKLEARPNHRTQLCIRLTYTNVKMLNRALDDHPIASDIINASVAHYLSRRGYARKREKESK